MIHLDINSSKIILAKEQHFKFLRCRINRKLGDPKCINKDCNICGSHKLSFKSQIPEQQFIINFFKKDKYLERILIGSPSDLIQINNLFFRAFLGSEWEDVLAKYKKIKKKDRENKEPKIFNLLIDIGKIFDYDEWLSKLEPVIEAERNNNYSLYEMAGTLDVRTCTYCNRSYTNTMTTVFGEKLMRPQFDHWFPKWKYPLLNCSFYNLIPSCYTCNSSSKGAVLLDLKTHIHPYIDQESLNEFQFNYIHSSKSTYHIFVKSLNSNLKAFNTLKAINIDRMYNAHIPELDDLIKLRMAYGENYIQRMIKLFPNAGLNEREIYNLVFGVEIDTKDFHKRPFSKFKYDILKELGIISSKPD